MRGRKHVQNQPKVLVLMSGDGGQDGGLIETAPSGRNPFVVLVDFPCDGRQAASLYEGSALKAWMPAVTSVLKDTVNTRPT